MTTRHPRSSSSSPPSAGQDLLIVLGEYVVSQQDGAWQATLVRALGLLGHSAAAVRQAISRAGREGALVMSRHGNRAHLRLADEAGRMLSDGNSYQEQSLLRAVEPAAWNGEWDVLVIRTANQDQAGRYQLRTAMMLEGLGYLGNGVWLAPRSPLRDTLTRALTVDGGIDPIVMTSRITHPDLAGLVRDTWDLEELAARYRGLVDQFATQKPETDAEHFVSWTSLARAWRGCAIADPRLPVEVLPADWPRRTAAELVLARREGWRPRAHAHFGTLVGDPDR